MQLSPEQRRAIIALACKVAWADGVVTVEERDYVLGLARRFVGSASFEAEVSEWLSAGGPEADLEQLPDGVGQMFFYEAFQLMESDSDLADVELEMLNTIMNRVFSKHPKDTPLARITLAKRAVPKTGV